MSMTTFAFQVRDEFERTGRVSSVDMNILAHLLHQMERGDDDEAEYMVDLLNKSGNVFFLLNLTLFNTITCFVIRPNKMF